MAYIWGSDGVVLIGLQASNLHFLLERRYIFRPPRHAALASWIR